MNLRRWNEAYPVTGLRNEIDRLFSTFFSEFPEVGPFNFGGGRSYPALNVWEDEQNLFVEAELPGLKMEDLEVLVTGDELTLKGERREVKLEGASYHRHERGVGAFSRTVRLPIAIDAGKVQAKLQEGVLTVTLPKSEASRPRKIEVKSVE